MKKCNLHSYSIMPLDTEHLEEICQDIKHQYDEGIASCALFCMTLVPEGDPPADKVGILCRKYGVVRDRLREMGLPSGVLVQASVGHGWVLGDMFPYQTHVNFTDGAATRVVCPCDDGFRDYIRNVMATIASHAPDHIMVDDDFRTIWYKGEGCACPMHMERFNRRADTSLSREELWEIVHTRTEEAKRLTDIFIEVQKESLTETALVMREGVDQVDPTMPMSYCCCGNNAEFAAEIASILAGEGNPVVVRINNGNYTPAGSRFFSRVFHRAATQIAKLRGKVDVMLAETDTCPQNRYSTGATSLHTHFTGTILEGAKGAKHWITRLISYEPESGKAYRRVLSKYCGFYNRLAELEPTLKWRGCRIYTPATPDFTYGRVKEEWDGWSYCVLERLGLPMHFSPEIGGVLCLEGDVDSRFSDEDVLRVLSGTVLLASDTAENLIRRGFGPYLGVDVREWTGKIPVREILNVNGCHTKVQMKTKELVPLSEETVADSWVCNTVGDGNYERLFPGVTVYTNALGGTVITFCGTPVAEFNLVEAFSFLTYSRKEQMIRLLKNSGELPVYYPDDEEVYLKVADTADGRLLAAVFNIGQDPIEELSLVCDLEASAVTRLTPDGEEEVVAFRREGDRYILDIPCLPLQPVVLFIK